MPASLVSPRENIFIESLFHYELAPHPTSLFDDRVQMRYTAKSILKNKNATTMWYP